MQQNHMNEKGNDSQQKSCDRVDFYAQPEYTNKVEKFGISFNIIALWVGTG